MKISSITDRPEKSFATANPVPVSNSRLDGRETYESVAVVIYQIVTEFLAGFQETFLQRSGVRRVRDIQVSIVSVVSGGQEKRRENNIIAKKFRKIKLNHKIKLLYKM